MQSRGNAPISPSPEGRGSGPEKLIRNKGPWRDINHLEVAVAEYVDWFNHRRLHGEIGHVPPVEYEQLHAVHPTPELLSISC